MDNTRRGELLAEIARVQCGEGVNRSNGTSPVTVRIGYVTRNNMVMDDGVVIQDCPPAILGAIVNWVDKANDGGAGLITCAMFDGGLLVS
jgi:hypothetical protein